MIITSVNNLNMKDMNMKITPTSSKPFKIILLNNFKFELSNYAQAFLGNHISATRTASNLIQFFSQGIFKQIVVDNSIFRF